MLIGSQLGFIAGSAPLVGTITQIGSGLTITNTANPAIASLSPTRVAVILTNSGQKLQAYDWNGSSWSAVGNATSLSFNGFNQDICALSATRVIVVGYDNPNYRTFIYCWDFDGTNWSNTGTTFLVTSSDPTTRVCALTSTDYAVITDVQSSTNARLETYTFNGSTHSKVGSTLTISGGANGTPVSLERISSTRVVAVLGFSSADDCVIYDWNGSTWSAVGSAGSFGVYTIFIATEGTTNVLASIDNSDIRPRKFDGSSFSTFGSVLSITGGSGRCGCSMGNNSFAYIDGTNDNLRYYTMT